MTMEQRLQQIIGAQVMQIVALQIEIEKLKAELEAVKNPPAPAPS